MIFSFLEETDALGWCIHFFMVKICHATVIGPRSKLHQLQVYQTMLGSRFMELVVYLSRHYDNQENAYYQPTPIAYLRRLRLERVCGLLKDSSLTITQIPHDCGFSDCNYFTRQFTESFGMSLKAYRNKL